MTVTPTLTWHSVDLKTGRRGQQLLTQTLGSISRFIGESSDLSDFAVACWQDGAPIPGWDAATLPGRTMLVACNELDEPMWGGVVLRRHDSGGIWQGLDVASLEAYLDRRYTRDHDFTATAQGAIISAIITGDVVASGPSIIVDAMSATERDRTYFDDDDKTVLSVLQELMGVIGGPEFTFDLEWSDDSHTMLNRILRVRDRLGTAATLPTTRFEFPSPVTSYDYLEDFSSDYGANDILATSSGEGAARPESSHAVATDLIAGGWVTFEERFEPSTSITDLETLDDHAAARLAEKKDGLAQLDLVSNLDEGPVPNIDFYLGDDITAVITSPRFPEQIGPDGDVIAGYTKTTRCTGWTIDYDARTVTPRLLEVG